MSQEEAERVAVQFALNLQLKDVDRVDGSEYASEAERHDGKEGGIWHVRVRRKLPEGVVTSAPFYSIQVEDTTGEVFLFTLRGLIGK